MSNSYPLAGSGTATTSPALFSVAAFGVAKWWIRNTGSTPLLLSFAGVGGTYATTVNANETFDSESNVWQFAAKTLVGSTTFEWFAEIEQEA